MPEQPKDPTTPGPFKPGVMAALAVHGIVPKADSDPRQIRAFLNDLYTFQIRELRNMRREAEAILGPQPLEPYRRRVNALKERYALLSLPADRWA